MDSIETPTSLKKLKLNELKEKCQALHLDTKGNKNVLLDRLLIHYGYAEEGSNGHEQPTVSITDDQSDLLNSGNVRKADDYELEPNDSDANLDLNCSDIEKPEIDLDFANEDLNQEDATATEEINHLKAVVPPPEDDWNEDETDFIRAKSEVKKPVETKVKEVSVKEFEVKYMSHVHLDPYLNDLNFVIDDDQYLSGTNDTSHGMSNFWCGVKGTHGVVSGSVQYSCQYLSDLNTYNKKDDCGIRIGFSSSESSLQLGEIGTSCGFDSSGKIYANGEIVAVYKPFGVGTVVSASINISSSGIIFTFNINNEDLGHSITLNSSKPCTMFPHIFFKNVKFKVDFSSLPHSPGCTSFEAIKDSLIKSSRPPVDISHAQLIMMVGLIASGKSTWVKEFIANNPNQYTVIGRSVLWSRWGRDPSSKQHLSERLVSQALSYLTQVASKRVRNFILDQTNYTSATRKRRIELFKQFGIKKAIVIIPRLSELAKRITEYNESRKKIGSDDRRVDMNELTSFKENMSLPTTEEGFTEIQYVDCDEKTAAEIMEDYKYDAKRYREANPRPKPISDTDKPSRIPRIHPPSKDLRNNPSEVSAKARRRSRSPIKQKMSPRKIIPPVSRTKDRLRAPKTLVRKTAYERESRKDDHQPRRTPQISQSFKEFGYKPSISERLDRRSTPPRFPANRQESYRSEYHDKPIDANFSTRRINDHYPDNRRTSGFIPRSFSSSRAYEGCPANHRRESNPRSYDSSRFNRYDEPSHKRQKQEYSSYNSTRSSRYTHAPGPY